MTDQNIQTIAIVDPRSLDGNPYEVAEIATAQAEALTQLAARQTENALKMGRNAASERSLVETGEVPDAQYEDTAEGKAFAAALTSLNVAAAKLKALKLSVAFNPRARAPKS